MNLKIILADAQSAQISLVISEAAQIVETISRIRADGNKLGVVVG